MTAGAELQAAVVAATSSLELLRGVFDGPPARAEFPYLVVDCSVEKAWNCSAHAGREVTCELTLWDDQPARILELEDALEKKIGQLASLPSWQLSSCSFQEKRKVRNPSGPWSCALRFRARMLLPLERAN